MKNHNISVNLFILTIQIWSAFAGYTQNPNEVKYNQFNEIQPNKQYNQSGYFKDRDDRHVTFTNLPDGDIISEGNSLPIQEITGQWASGQGFEAYWKCEGTNSAPESNKKDVFLYQNPVSNYVIINLQNTVTGILNVSITKIIDEIVINKNYLAFNGALKVNLNRQVDGLYLVKLDFNG